MTDKLREAAQMALDAYESRMQQIGGCSDGGCVVVKPKGMHTNGGCRCWKNERSMQRLAMAANSLTKALRAALAQPQQPEQEPVAYLCENAVGHKYFRWKKPTSVFKPIPLYTAPPQREWQGLTDDDFIGLTTPQIFAMKFAEAKLKEKNGAI